MILSPNWAEYIEKMTRDDVFLNLWEMEIFRAYTSNGRDLTYVPTALADSTDLFYGHTELKTMEDILEILEYQNRSYVGFNRWN